MTQTLTIKNIGRSPTFVHTLAGQRSLGVGETARDVEFSDAEGRTVNANRDVFEVSGYVEPKDGGGVPASNSQPAGRRDENNDTADMRELRKQFDKSYSALQGELRDKTADHLSATADVEKLRSQLQGIADLFETPDVDALNVHAAVERLIQDHAELLESTTAPKSTLAEAVSKLDDKNDDHWTQAGQPKLAALEKLFGGDVSAADYAALPDDAKRVRSAK